MKVALTILFVICLIGIGCLVNSKPAVVPNIKRYGSITGLKPDSVQVYKELHAHAWPAVLKKLKECNIRNYSIYIKQIDGSPYLFSYFEYVGDDFNADMQKMAADPNTQKWWKRTDPTQIPLSDAAAKGKIWSDMQEVFHTE
ncbi:L-rhamnose mutarotase [Mucilaginibacter sp. UYP25]|uniref:L-rhamnose mutarotase n=1 Tax=unclassified Mucilaginibacter TaxID=2617802 RepID=UPI00339A45F9